MVKRLVRIAIALGVIFANLWAGTTGKIVGTVIDVESKAPLPLVNIIVEGTHLGAASDMKGNYVILNIPPGYYTVKATMMGYKEMRVTRVRVMVDLTTRVDFDLQPTIIDLEEAVTVVAERPLIQPDVTFSSVAVGGEEIAEMPVEEFEEVIAIQAGVVTGSGGELHIRGGRSNEIAYMIDGISVTDPYSGSMAVEVENTAIQELQVISGAFSAEYGQAMSAIVNIVTKEPGSRLTGEFKLSTGDYLSLHKDKNIFPHIREYEPLDIKDVQASINGPVPGLDKYLSFFATGRYYDSDGYLYGIKWFLPSDSSNFESPYPTEWYSEYHGATDSVHIKSIKDHADVVPMNPYKELSGQIKLTFRPLPSIKLSYESFRDRKDYSYYSHAFKYNPDGNLSRHSGRYSHFLIWTHNLSSKTFYEAKFSQYNNSYRHYVNPIKIDDDFNVVRDNNGDIQYDKDIQGDDTTKYVHSDLLKSFGYSFHTGGTDMEQFYRNTKTMVAKAEVTSQVHPIHLVKSGIEFRMNELKYLLFYIIPKRDASGIEINPFKPDVPPLNSPNHDRYIHHPYEAAFYVQDKLELKDMIVNLGIRFDYFQPDGKYPSDPRDPDINNPIKRENRYHDLNNNGTQDPGEPEVTLAEREKYWYEKASPKTQISPRFGIAYPISDRGVIHFSYGHFLQIPTYSYLYVNPEFEAHGGYRTMGNADLEPQRTVSYEIGLQQQLTENLGINVTGYYRDIRNWLGTEIIETYSMGTRYAKYITRDYGNVRGFTLSITKRHSNYVSARVDYTFQVAEGNASDPNAGFYDALYGREPEKQLVYLDWDQSHTLNFSVTVNDPGRWGVSLLGQLESGLPYTPAYRGERTSFENSERKPVQYNFDLKTHKDFRVDRFKVSIFLNIYNIFDRLNEDLVYTDTGTSGYSMTQHYYRDITMPLNSLDEWHLRPDYYSNPRQMKLGITLGF